MKKKKIIIFGSNLFLYSNVLFKKNLRHCLEERTTMIFVIDSLHFFSRNHGYERRLGDLWTFLFNGK
jgi:hypothetical protein